VSLEEKKPIEAAALQKSAFGTRNGLAYGLMGFPLAFAALPLYVILPNHYARAFGVPLATLGVVLLGARLFDAFIDPAIGKLVDRLFTRSTSAVLAFGALAAVVLATGFLLLFFPPALSPTALVAWASLMLMITYAGYSALTVAHQAWGALLGGSETQQSRIVAWREGLGLLGVVTASVLPALMGLPLTAAVFCAALALAWLGWQRAVRPAAGPAKELALAHTAGHSTAPAAASVWLPWHQAQFRRLMTVFIVNGIASAVPATLVLFFIQDLLQAPPALEPLFLGSYFLSAALAIPLWLKAVKRLGLARSWLAGMALSILVFIWAGQLGAGDVALFALVCALSGAALGADLALPGALLAGVIHAGQARHPALAAGGYFGWWNFATKLNLALAAGLALPLLSLFGYAPGVRDAGALQALAIAYCLLPCLLKMLAAVCLYVLVIRPAREESST
jgi:GPH family glycoside/pentoside/hexuronide:cation symporter